MIGYLLTAVHHMHVFQFHILSFFA